jgi:hypothetical protein
LPDIAVVTATGQLVAKLSRCSLFQGKIIYALRQLDHCLDLPDDLSLAAGIGVKSCNHTSDLFPLTLTLSLTGARVYPQAQEGGQASFLGRK